MGGKYNSLDEGKGTSLLRAIAIQDDEQSQKYLDIHETQVSQLKYSVNQ